MQKYLLSLGYLRTFWRKNNMSFNLVLSNPPFQVGNKIAQTSLKVAKQSVFLVPLNSLEAKGVYKNVKKFNLIDTALFSDAYLSRNTGIAVLDPTYKLGDIEELKDLTRDPAMLPIYIYIREHSPTYKNYLYAAKASRPELNINPKTWFKVTHQAVVDGVHSTDPANDRDWNIHSNDTDSYDGSNCIFYDMGSEKAKVNITHWWYYKGKKGLANALLTGLRKRLTTNKEMMPCIDWNKDVEYTDEYVLSEMGFELIDPANVAKGFKRKNNE